MSESNPDKRVSHVIREIIDDAPYPGYPRSRLYMPHFDSSHNAALPDGPWTASYNPPPDSVAQLQLQQSGCTLDTIGRPLHPWLDQMITDPTSGVVTGMGHFWRWGPNYTADPIVIADTATPKVLLIQRKDTNDWALPGGFVDSGETSLQAATRELFEEAGVDMDAQQSTLVYDGPVADPRATAHAWPHTSAYVWRIDTALQLRAGDDASSAKWIAVDALPDQLHGSHKALIAAALQL